MDYDFRAIEAKWQKTWKETDAYKVTEDPNRPKFYVLDMFPTPLGQGFTLDIRSVTSPRMSSHVTSDTRDSTCFIRWGTIVLASLLSSTPSKPANTRQSPRSKTSTVTVISWSDSGFVTIGHARCAPATPRTIVGRSGFLESCSRVGTTPKPKQPVPSTT